MTLKTKDLENFKVIYKSKFDIDLTDKQALEYWISLVSFIKILLSNNIKIWK